MQSPVSKAVVFDIFLVHLQFASLATWPHLIQAVHFNLQATGAYDSTNLYCKIQRPECLVPYASIIKHFCKFMRG